MIAFPIAEQVFDVKKSYPPIIACIVAAAGANTVYKLTLNDLPTMEVLCLGCVAASIIFFVLVGVTGTFYLFSQYQPKDFLITALLGVLGMFAYCSFYYFGMTQMSARDACILNNTWPLMVVVFACVIQKEPVTLRKVIGLSVCFLGIVVLCLGGDHSSQGNFFLGAVSILTGTVCYGLFSGLNKKFDYNPLLSMVIIWPTTTLLALVAGLLTQDFVVITTPSAWGGILYMGIMMQAVSNLCMIMALRYSTNAAKVASLMYLAPFFSLTLSAVVLKETISWSAILSLLMIIGGILYQNLPELLAAKSTEVKDA